MAKGKDKERNSNIELMRIVVMAAIVAHHYVVNSGVRGVFDAGAYPANTLFLQIWGLFGKAGIDAFVLITGYFMCNSRMTTLRYLKVVVPILLYRAMQLAISVAIGATAFSLHAIAEIPLSILRNAGHNGSFSSSIIVFYLLVPILIETLKSLPKEVHRRLVIASLLLYTGLETFFGNPYLFNEVLWFCVLFVLASWVRNYPSEWMSDVKAANVFLLVSVSLTALSVVAIDFLFPGKNAYYLVSSPARLGSITIGLATFLFFRNLSIPQSRLINWVASHTFGVLLFHANSIGRRYLWEPGGLFDTQAAYMSTLPHLMLNSFFAVVFVLAVGTVFDAVVASPIENLLYKLLSKSERKL